MKLQEILGITYPFIQGGMANIAKGPFAAAVSNGGGLGMIGTGGMLAKDLKGEIQKAKSLTDRPFGVNVLLLHPQVEEMMEIICEEKVPLVTTGAGNPEKYMDRLKDHGIKVFPLVASSALARRMERMGADGVIAEGTEAGGHIGELTTMVLLPEVVSQVKIPVIAAGGIGSGAALFAAEVLGAAGAQLGTAMLFTEECPIHPNYKDKLLQAKSSQSTVIGRINGYPTRVVKNRMTRKYQQLEVDITSKDELELLTLGALRKAVYEGDVKEGSVMAGQIVGQFHEILPVAKLMEQLYQDYEREKSKYVVG